DDGHDRGAGHGAPRRYSLQCRTDRPEPVGQNLAFSAPGRNNVAGAFAGLNVSYWLSQTANLFAAVEATAMSDNSKTGIVQGGLRIALN
ncbi:MAG: hypothetical protein WCG00_15190, partial [Hyphomicrobiales bacterium]